MKYFGLMSQSKYVYLNNTPPDTYYIKSYKRGKLISTLVDDNYINKIETNNIFSYTLTFNNSMLKTTEIIKSSNTYTVNILDNYQHIDNIVISDDMITTNGISFYSKKMVDPLDVSVG